MDKVVHIMDTLPLCGPPCGHAALAALSRFRPASSPLPHPPPCAYGPAIRMGLFFCRTFPVSAVTRLQVAEIFGKRHDHVLREIEYILTQAPEIFIESNFGCNEAEYRAVFDASA